MGLGYPRPPELHVVLYSIRQRPNRRNEYLESLQTYLMTVQKTKSSLSDFIAACHR